MDGQTDGGQHLMRPPRGRVAHNNVGDECPLISGVERLECVDLRRHHHHCVVRTGRRLPGRSDRGLRGRAGCRVDHGLPALANSTHRQRCAAASYRHHIGQKFQQQWRRQVATGACAPAGKPSPFHSVIQHQFLCVSQYTILHTNRCQLLVLTEGAASSRIHPQPGRARGTNEHPSARTQSPDHGASQKS